MKDVLKTYRDSMRVFTDLVHQIRDDQWSNSTPCTEWTVRDLVNHMVYEHRWAPELLAGRTIAQVGAGRYDGDQLGEDPKGAWDQASAESLARFSDPGVLGRIVHLSYGDCTAASYGAEMTVDLAVHAWDLARGIGADDRLPDDIVAEVYAWARPRSAGITGTPWFGPAVRTGPDADDQTAMLGLLGRRR